MTGFILDVDLHFIDSDVRHGSSSATACVTQKFTSHGEC